jgi:hypothetical protein
MSAWTPSGAIMNEDMLNMSVRNFLKKVGVTSQREIEEAVRLAVISGQLSLPKTPSGGVAAVAES